MRWPAPSWACLSPSARSWTTSSATWTRLTRSACMPCCTPTWPRRWPRSWPGCPSSHRTCPSNRGRGRAPRPPGPTASPPHAQEADVSDSPRKVALVTGGARGIGAATALRLARDGNAVGVLDLDESACAATVSTITGDGGSAVALGADVGDSAQVTAAVDLLAGELGGPTVLVNNAGITRDNLLFK